MPPHKVLSAAPPQDSLTFVHGDAQKLPFPDSTFDAVINVEASHCYPDFPCFLSEVARALRPAAIFSMPTFVSAMASLLGTPPSPPHRWRPSIAHSHDEVLRGLDCNADRNLALIRQRLPLFLHSFGRDFAGLPGSASTSLFKRRAFYRSWCLRKP